MTWSFMTKMHIEICLGGIVINLQVILQIKCGNLRMFKVFSIELLTHGKLQIKHMATCDLPRLRMFG